MVTPTVRDDVLTPVVSCWPVKAVGAKNASGEKQVKPTEGCGSLRVHELNQHVHACDSSLPHKTLQPNTRN